MNEYGLDVPYFKGKLEQIIRGIDRYTPGEMMRALERLAEVAQTQADRADASRGQWQDLPSGTGNLGRCPAGAGGKRIAVRYRDGTTKIWQRAVGGPDWIHDGGPLDIVAWALLGEPR